MTATVTSAREHKHEAIARMVRQTLGPPGSTLPSEAELITRYGVSRGTVRQALAALEAEGLITSTQGNLRRVRENRRWRWDMTEWESRHRANADAWAATIEEQGGTPSASARVEFIAAPDDVAKALEIEPGTPIVTRSRVRSVNGEPHQLSDSFFPPWVTQDNPLITRPGDVAAPGGLLAASGHTQVRFHDELTARPPTVEEAAQLRMPTGAPLLIHARIGYDEQGRPVRYMSTRMAADRVLISYDLSA